MRANPETYNITLLILLYTTHVWANLVPLNYTITLCFIDAFVNFTQNIFTLLPTPISLIGSKGENFRGTIKYIFDH